MKPLILTPSQQTAIDSFKSFLESNDQVFMLKGAAGTGKTTLVNEFLKILAEKKWESALMAPTGRAAHIIGSKTGCDASTIHRSIYCVSKLEVNEQNTEEVESDDSSFHIKFGLKLNDNSYKCVYIVDEASMISDAYSENEAFSFGTGLLLSDLLTFAHGRKIVFVGDYAQLPPVGMNFSPALDKEYIENKFNCKVCEVVLREVLRQAEHSVMLNNANNIRNAIDTKTFIEFKLNNGHDCITEDINLLRPYYSIKQDTPSSKAAIITYSNAQALAYNLSIRKHYFGEDCSRLKVGDLLMIVRNNYAYGIELFNGNIVKVASCEDDNSIISRKINVKTGKDQIETIELRFRKVCICFNKQGKVEHLNVTILDNFLDDLLGSIGGSLASALVVDFNNRLPKEIKTKLPEIRKKIRKKESLTIEEKELYDSYLNLLNSDPYYNAVICKYGYAMTCHKAQGGEWENVFVDMCRFGGTSNEDYFRWAYTALTRASEKLWHYRSPEFNYISNLVVEPIQKVSNIRVSTYSESDDFCMTRFSRISKSCRLEEIDVVEDKTRNFQHWITFKKINESATFILWYNANGYSNKDVLHKKSSDDFASICKTIIDNSYVPLGIPFSAPNRPFAEKLVGFVKSILNELDIQLLDITQEQYQDVFHIKTDGLAKVTLSYTGKGNYTYMKLQSSIGVDDKKLEEFRNRFK